MEIILAVLFYIFIVEVIFKFKKVPKDTIIIIDRNGHYFKTLRHGYYRLGSKDKITTQISENTLSRTILNYYETHDGYVLAVNLSCSYKAANVDAVLNALENVRRSIDDIIQSSVFFAIRNCSYRDVMANQTELKEKINENLSKELDSIEVQLINANSLISPVPFSNVKYFKPHVSSCINSSDTPHPHEYSIITKDNNDDNPIKFYK